MKTVRDLKREFSDIKSKRLPRTDKMPFVKAIRGGVQQIEIAAARNFSFPLDEIQKAKAFLIELDDYLRP